MNCEDVQIHLHDFVKRRLDPALNGDVGAHLEGCAACSSAERAEHVLDELLEQRLPRYAAPNAFKRRLGLLVGRPASARVEPGRWTRVIAPAMAAGLLLLAGGVLLSRSSSQRSELATLTSEVVNDHLRVLASEHPVEIESGGTHQVKPWFEGKLDFAPVVPAPEGSELRLRGGSVGYVFDRKAAVIVYALRLHAVTLLVFRPEGLPWPDTGARQLGPARGREVSARGFNVVLWRDGGLAYALVSDVNEEELRGIAARFAAATVHAPGP
ncbi:anti-sigma factor family protein [Anaeromyxobacter terrae]|uniref:anti-sigma factor family protein n=1 Tax=Anaeromyxobacter terrae TaxID=2925406 RepID=UPI001F5651A6|nr:zf-HC2 domain-containing protein [Anaeromyxobacter sp. SG22]